HGGLYRRAAEEALKAAGTDKGYCLVLGAGHGRLAYEIAKRSHFTVIGIEEDPRKVAEARRILRATGLYGTCVSIHNGPLDLLPFGDRVANLVVSEQTLLSSAVPATPADEVLRVLRPCGGTAVVPAADGPLLDEWASGVLPGWAVAEEGDDSRVRCWGTARRGALPGAGEWTHTYAEPGNTACSGDTRVGAPLTLQWFGRPGPRRMMDRHFRNVPPLYKDGRLFIPGNEVVYAVDAYNGAALWQAEIPGSRRAGVFLDSSNMVVDEAFLYLAVGDQCLRFDVATGHGRDAFTLPPHGDASALEWGYLARVGELLLGSARTRGASYREITREAELDRQPLWYPNMKVALSRYVFAAEPGTGAARWTYGQGRIVDTTLTAGGGRLYFIESESPAACADETGRLPMRALTAAGTQYLVAVELESGHIAYREPVDLLNLQQPAYLSYADGVLLLSGSKIDGGEGVRSSGYAAIAETAPGQCIHYHYYAFDAGTGQLRWAADHETDLPLRGGHGEYNRHPTIVGSTAYAWPYAYDLGSGRRLDDWKFDRRGHGCGGVSACASGLFWRGHNPWMYDLRPGQGPRRINEVSRPGCWINIIPAGGLVLIPEASSGCTCGYPIQTSIAYAPAKREG
ncbi:MAG: methyltransferase domain-containing protein, partial [Candidatus Hydrogenedentes bacterium]|nr:methyltransferase domain-containing protein [Candidatus Hydrogenedentota bacterium]